MTDAHVERVAEAVRRIRSHADDRDPAASVPERHGEVVRPEDGLPTDVDA
jgi:hypothetical protein